MLPRDKNIPIICPESSLN